MPGLQLLAQIGGAGLLVHGLNPQRLSTKTEARVPGAPTWGGTGMDYQSTGLGERSTRIEGLTYPHVIGGLDALGWLIAQHRDQVVCNYIRMGPNMAGTVMGQVRIRNLYADETRLHPRDGVARRVAVEIDLLYVDDAHADPTLFGVPAVIV